MTHKRLQHRNWAIRLLTVAFMATFGSAAYAAANTGSPPAPAKSVVAQANAVTATNAIENVTSSSLPGGKVIVKFTMKQPLDNPPGTFSVNTPPRIALDFANTVNALGKSAIEVHEGELRGLNLVQSGNRTRVVMSLNRAAIFDTKVEGKTLLVTLQSGESAPSVAQTPQRFAEPSATPQSHSDVW
jgi:type IV pilus assembly protein PilQ